MAPKRTIPQAMLDELEAIWEADKRLPTLQSRRKWCLARNLDPQMLHRWYSRKRCGAKRKHEDLPPDSDLYDLEVGTPPELPVTVKIEAEPSTATPLKRTRKLPKWPESGIRRSRRLQVLTIDVDIPSSPDSTKSFFAGPSTSTFTTPDPDDHVACPKTPLVVPAVPTPRTASPIRSDSPDILQHCGLSLSSCLYEEDITKAQVSLECTRTKDNRDSGFTCVLCSDSEQPSLASNLDESSHMPLLSLLNTTSYPAQPMLSLPSPLPSTNDEDSSGLSTIALDSRSPMDFIYVLQDARSTAHTLAPSARFHRRFAPALEIIEEPETLESKPTAPSSVVVDVAVEVKVKQEPGTVEIKL
ncbi:hypothetical protein AAF712_005738 [Marasmius tenuissimus]|uniref:Uncharacterized protein n=1 Tax=Marasmius tenuissimus TaxID=585030 RepID=A0ABR3A0K5_9AGAR